MENNRRSSFEVLKHQALKALVMINPGLFSEELAGAHGSEARLYEMSWRLHAAKIQGNGRVEFRKLEESGEIVLELFEQKSSEAALSVYPEEMASELISNTQIHIEDRPLASFELEVVI